MFDFHSFVYYPGHENEINNVDNTNIFRSSRPRASTFGGRGASDTIYAPFDPSLGRPGPFVVGRARSRIRQIRFFFSTNRRAPAPKSDGNFETGERSTPQPRRFARPAGFSKRPPCKPYVTAARYRHRDRRPPGNRTTATRPCPPRYISERYERRAQIDRQCFAIGFLKFYIDRDDDAWVPSKYLMLSSRVPVVA